jgi:hypothetical protein
MGLIDHQHASAAHLLQQSLWPRVEGQNLDAVLQRIAEQKPRA